MSAPVLFFSDLTDGPRTGWNGSSTVGAAVTIWGNNFGSSRGSSYITVAGQNLVNASDYAEWGVTTNNARGMERITFYLNSSCSTGAQTISVTVNGITSNTLPFYVRTTGNIRFVATSGGSDSYDGTQDAYVSGSNGPWATITYGVNNVGASGILYVRTGSYGETLEVAGEHAGTENNMTAWCAYPGEYPVTTRWGVRGTDYPNLLLCYVTLSKMTFKGTGVFISMSYYSAVGQIRLIGLDLDGENTYPISSTWSGAFVAHNGIGHLRIYGMRIHDWGVDKYDHAMYFGDDTNAPNTGQADNDIGWCEVYDLGRTGGSEVSGIYIHPFDWSTDGQCDVNIHDCYIHNVDSAGIFFNSRVGDCYVYNNIIANCGITTRSAIGFWAGDGAGTITPGNVRFYNNTVYGHKGSGTTFLSFGGTAVYSFKNNLFVTTIESIPYISDSTWSGTRSSNNDLWYGSGAPPGWAVSPLNSDPLFVTSGSDFHLQSTSPCIDAGVDVSSVVTTDYDGLNRGAIIDIGAYEYYTSIYRLVFKNCTLNF